ncbi:MAG: ATPase domain-containing protein [Candidatus Micrarchaeota archaeon]|nr:ATPase domain-containing protein [Candidatus Micrarchaeota archaeon]
MDKYTVERIPSGIPGFDKIIDGGIQKNSVLMVRGGTGTGKTLFGLQYLYHGAKENDDPGIFISFAESKEAIYQHGILFDWDFNALEKKNKFVFIKYAPHEVVKIIEEGGGTIRDTVEAIGAKRMVIDSLTAYALLFESEYRSNESVLNLFEMLRKWNCTTMVTSEKSVNPNDGDTERLGFFTDGIINFYYLRNDTSRVRALEIIKMRDTKHSTSISPFEITKNGLVVKPDGKVPQFK